MLSSVKMALVLIVITSVGGGLFYVKKLQADLAISEANNAKLEQAVGQQKAVIEQQKKDVAAIRTAMVEQSKLNEKLNQSINDLRNKFHKVNASGKKRDIGDLAVKKPALMQRAINRGTANALRCVEIAMGSPLTEKEKNATKKSQINPECPSVANPNYVPYGN